MGLWYLLSATWSIGTRFERFVILFIMTFFHLIFNAWVAFDHFEKCKFKSWPHSFALSLFCLQRISDTWPWIIILRYMILWTFETLLVPAEYAKSLRNRIWPFWAWANWCLAPYYLLTFRLILLDFASWCFLGHCFFKVWWWGIWIIIQIKLWLVVWLDISGLNRRSTIVD